MNAKFIVLVYIPWKRDDEIKRIFQLEQQLMLKAL